MATKKVASRPVSKKKVVTKKVTKRKKKFSGPGWPVHFWPEVPYWHVHHRTLWEMMSYPTSRIRAIRVSKPPKERPTRLALMQVMDLNEKQREALLKYNQARYALNDYEMHSRYDYKKAKKLQDKVAEARRAFCNTIEDVLQEMHKEQCGKYNCPWNGHTIFPHEP